MSIRMRDNAAGAVGSVSGRDAVGEAVGRDRG